MGSALLLGPGLAAAIDLDGAVAPTPIMIATQTIPAASVNAAGSTTATHSTVDIGDVDFEITPGVFLEADDGYFLRVAFGGGMIIAALPGTAPGGGTPVQGGVGHSQVVYRLADVELLTAGNPTKITFEADTALAVASTDAADYTATMTIHTEQFDAIDGVKKLRNIGKEDVVVVRAVSGVDATITPKGAVADVATGFRWFVNPTPTVGVPNVSGLALGTANATAATTGGALDAGGLATGDTNTAAGSPASSADLISTGGVTIGIEGDFSVGVFDLVETMIDDPANPGTDIANSCPARKGTAATPTMKSAGNVSKTVTEEDPTTAMVAGLNADEYMLCVEVDLAGSMSNDMAIPAGDYVATVYTRTGDDPRDNMMENEGVIGTITRNGASVSIAYLTTSEKHNQRLIIVNRGTRPISMTDITFQSEDGTEADLSDAAKAAAAVSGAGLIMPGEAVMHRVSDMLSITGNSRRTAATLAFNGVASQISVATTQVNLSDGSTDTVMWPVN